MSAECRVQSEARRTNSRWSSFCALRSSLRAYFRRKFPSSTSPPSVRKLSGWYWTPSSGHVLVADAHDLVVVGPAA